MSALDDSRVDEMYLLYVSGQTLEQVGREFGVTRERVRQIFVAEGLRVRSVAETAWIRRRREEAKAEEGAEEIVLAFKESGDYGATARALGMTIATVRRVVKDRVPDYRRYRKREAVGLLYSDEDLLRCLREASRASGGVLTGKAYVELAKGRSFEDGRSWPSFPTIVMRLDSWRNALRTAGLPANPTTPIGAMRTFERQDCIAAIRRVARKLGRVPTVAEYTRHATASNGKLPSLATVRHRCGTWWAALDEADLF